MWSLFFFLSNNANTFKGFDLSLMTCDIGLHDWMPFSFQTRCCHFVQSFFLRFTLMFHNLFFPPNLFLYLIPFFWFQLSPSWSLHFSSSLSDCPLEKPEDMWNYRGSWVAFQSHFCIVTENPGDYNLRWIELVAVPWIQYFRTRKMCIYVRTLFTDITVKPKPNKLCPMGMLGSRCLVWSKSQVMPSGLGSPLFLVLDS